jgi:molybdate transport system permease protein
MPVILAILGWSILATSGCSGTEPVGALDVHCAASVHHAISDAASSFEAETGQAIRIHTGASSTLANQIIQGDRSHVFISANRLWVDSLVKNGFMLPGSIRKIASNRLVLASTKDTSFSWTPSLPLPQAFGGRLLMADPAHVPAGMHAKDALQDLGQWNDMVNRLAFTPNSSATVAQLLAGDTRAAIVYRSDLKRSTALRMVHEFKNVSPSLWAGNLGDNEGHPFLEYLASPKGLHHLTKHGFLPPDNAIPGDPHQGKTDYEGWSEVVLLSLRVALFAVLLILPFGIFFGWLLARRDFRGKTLLDALIHVPLVLPPVVTGYALLWVFGRHGPLHGMGLAFSWQGAALASAVVAFPLFVRAARLGFEGTDRKLEEAAASLGVSPLSVFLRVSLPLAMGGILSGTLLAFGRALGEFGATITFAGSVVGETETLPLAIYAALQSPNGGELATTLAVISTLLAFGTLLLGEWLARRVRWKS